MAAVRPVLPTDLAALVGSGRTFPNEAVTLDRIGNEPSPRPIEAVEQWLSFATGKHTWISVRGATLRGLVSARRRGSAAAWEIDCLIDAAEDDPGVLMSLLDRMSADAGEAHAEKIFLRIPQESEALASAARCGFVPYATELIFERGPGDDSRDPGPASPAVRRWVRSDAHDTFRLYNRCVPDAVRRVEAATLGEWQAAREKIGPRSSQWVITDERGLTGWLRTSTGGEIGRFECIADDPALLDGLISVATHPHGERKRFCSRVYEFGTDVQQALLGAGFVISHQYKLLAKPVARRVAIPELVPAPA
jgi:hypothetical protein